MQTNTLLGGLIGSSTVSVAVQPMAATLMIKLSTVYRLGLLLLFDRFGRYACNTSLSVPTASGFYTSRMSLRCCHAQGDSDIVLGPDWVSASGVC